MLVARLSTLSFIGVGLCRNAEWLDIATKFMITRFTAVADVQLWPRALHPFIHWFLPSCRNLRAEIKRARELVEPELEHQLRERENRASPSDQPFSALLWIDEQAKGAQYDATMAQLRLIFAAVHTTSDMLSKLIMNICKYPELIEALREEIISVMGMDGVTIASLKKLWLMDSVMKESQRLEPVSLCMAPLKGLIMTYLTYTDILTI